MSFYPYSVILFEISMGTFFSALKLSSLTSHFDTLIAIIWKNKVFLLIFFSFSFFFHSPLKASGVQIEPGRNTFYAGFFH